ncbi:MAG: hypothetical protein LBO69_05140 [Ignavibacteria bacterium]|jgi:hypothetical protein|nr:hypothetical protein [Ignavibacteria bacterium]
MLPLNRIISLKVLFLLSLCYFCLISCSDDDVSDNPEADFSHFEFAYQIGNAIINPLEKTVSAEISTEGDIYSLTPTFVLSDGATAYIDDVMQISGQTANDFSKVVEYRIVSANMQITSNWKVTISQRYVDGGDEDLGTSIDVNSILPAGEFHITQNLKVGNNVFLELSPGTTLIFSPNTKLTLGKDATLLAYGTKERPISFIAKDVDGPWSGIILTDADAVFEYCNFSYAGSGAPLLTLQNSTANIKHCNITNIANTGISLDAKSKFAAFDYNTIDKCAEQQDGCYPIILNSINSISAIGYSNSITTTKGIYIENSAATTNISINGLECPYIFQNDITAAVDKLTFFIHEGTTIVMNKGKKIELGINGDIRFEVAGTPAHPVSFSSATKKAGDWEGIQLGRNLLPNSGLTFCNIYYAGNGANSGAIYCNATDTSRLSLHNCAIAFTNSHGIYFTKYSDAKQGNVVFSNIPTQYSDVFYEE